MAIFSLFKYNQSNRIDVRIGDGTVKITTILTARGMLTSKKKYSWGHRRSQDFWLGGAKTLKIPLSSPKLRVVFQPKSEIRTIFPPKIRWSPKKKRSSPKMRVVFQPKQLALLLLNCCHNFLSLVEFWLGGGPGPLGPPLATPMVGGQEINRGGGAKIKIGGQCFLRWRSAWSRLFGSLGNKPLRTSESKASAAIDHVENLVGKV